MKLFDLHCDTALEIFQKKEKLDQNTCHVSLKGTSNYDGYAQVMAIWTPKTLSDAQGYAQFFKVAEYLKNQLSLCQSNPSFVTNGAEFSSAADRCSAAILLSVEDARILENDICRLEILYNHGVRFLTLLWAGETNIGGAHDTASGLTDFGCSVVKKCFSLGIVPDISHASFASADQVLSMAESQNKPVIASHSDSFSVCSHSRNLKDRDFERIKKLHGLVGINLCPEHLGGNPPSVSTVLSHIEHYYSLGGENTVALGTDLDGTSLPKDFTGNADIIRIADEMARLNYTDIQIQKIFWQNAAAFVKNNL